MKFKVISEGNINMIDFPFLINNDNWLIPKGWYLLDNPINSKKIKVLYNDKKIPIIIKENIHIYHIINDKKYKTSVIKTDKKININDILTK
jgi:hypothetical protein